MYYSTHRPWWGPTFPLSKLELAVMSASGIALDSIPKGAMHCAEKEKKNGIFGYARFLDTPPLINMIYWKTFITRDTYDRSHSKNSYYSCRRYRPPSTIREVWFVNGTFKSAAYPGPEFSLDQRDVDCSSLRRDYRARERKFSGKTDNIGGVGSIRSRKLDKFK